MKYIACRINGKDKRLKVCSGPIPEARGKRPDGWDTKTPTLSGNVWPWRYMQAGDVVRIDYNLANYYQIENSIKGFCKSRKDVRFSYRSDLRGIDVLRLS